MFHRCPFDANIQAVYFKIVTDNEVDLILSSSGDNAGLECPSVSYAVNKINGVFQHGVSTPAAASNVTAIGGTNVVTNTTTTSLDSIYVKENTYSDPLVAVDPSGLGGTLTGRYRGAGGGVSPIYAKLSHQTTGSINTGSTAYRALPDSGM